MDLGSHTFGTSLVGLGVFGDGAGRGEGVREIMARYAALIFNKLGGRISRHH